MNQFENSCQNILQLLEIWEPRLLALSEEIISNRKNIQNRSIRQILGHLFDSASNNTHRIVHLQYRENPMTFPNYATEGNNDRWIAIQDYQHEDWNNLVQLWKYANLHLIHVIRNVDPPHCPLLCCNPNSLSIIFFDYFSSGFQISCSQ